MNFIRGKENKSEIFLFLPNFFRLVEIYSLWKIIKVNIRIKRNIGKLHGQRSWKYTRQGLKEFRMYRWGKRLTAPWIIRLKEWKSTRHGIEINLYLSLFIRLHITRYMRERERERRIVNGVQWCVVFFNKNCWTRNIPLSERKGGRISGNLWKYSDLGGECIAFYRDRFQKFEKKRKKKKGDYNNASRYFNKFIPSFFLKSIPIHLQFP